MAKFSEYKKHYFNLYQFLPKMKTQISLEIWKEIVFDFLTYDKSFEIHPHSPKDQQSLRMIFFAMSARKIIPR